MAILFCGIVMSHYTHLNLSPVAQITTQLTFRTIAFIAGLLSILPSIIIIIYYAKMQHIKIQYKNTYIHTATRTHELSSRKESGHDHTQHQQNVSTYIRSLITCSLKLIDGI